MVKNEEQEGFALRMVCRQVKSLGGGSYMPQIHLGIGDGAVDLVTRLGGVRDISVYEDATAIEGVILKMEGVEVRVQRPHRQATSEEVALLQQSKRPSLWIPAG